MTPVPTREGYDTNASVEYMMRMALLVEGLQPRDRSDFREQYRTYQILIICMLHDTLDASIMSRCITPIGAQLFC